MIIKLRYWIRLSGAFLVRFKGIIFVGIIVGLFLFAGIRFFSPFVLGNSTEYIGISGRYHTEGLPQEVLRYMGEGLTLLTPKGEIEPALAESWEESEDGKVWTFKLQEGNRWHDGTEVTSDTIQYSFEDAEIERPDKHTIRFRLNSPFAPFPSVVAKPTFKKGLLGTGEWKVQALALASSYIEQLVLINPLEERKIIRFYPSEESTKLAFQLGRVDKIVDILDPAPFEAWNNVAVEKISNSNRFVAIFFNNSADPFKGTDAKPLRQALSYAIRKTDFEGSRALGPVSPDSWAYNPQVKSYEYNVERAKELMENVKDLEINLTTTPALLKVADKVSKDWSEIGVKTNVQVVSVVPTEYQAFLAIYDVPVDPDQYSIWHTTQGETNIANYSNPRIDKLLEDGRLQLDREERKKIYLDFQRFLLEDAPAVFLYHPVSYTISRK